MGTHYNRLVEAVLTSTHNLCFGAKIRKIGTCIPLHTPVLLYKRGVKGGTHFTDVFLMKLLKKKSCLLVRANSFSNRVEDNWNSLTEDIVSECPP